MNSIYEAVRKGPLMTMTLECETEFPKALKDLMVAMGIHGAAVYKGFPVMDEGVEYWWVQLHLYKNKEDNHKDSGFCMVTNSVMHTTFLIQQGMKLGRPSKNLVIESSAECSTPRMILRKKRNIPKS